MKSKKDYNLSLFDKNITYGVIMISKSFYIKCYTI